MTEPSRREKDWHLTFQNDDYLNLSLKRLEGKAQPLDWCVQISKIIRHHVFSHTGPFHRLHDIGCNVGHFCRVLSELPPEIEYHGYDISETYLGLARQHHPAYNFSYLDISDQQPENMADVSVISATLEHIEQWEDALANILDSSRQLVLLRSFFDTQPSSDMYQQQNAIKPYIIWQFTFEQLAKAAKRRGFCTRFLRDHATDSIPQYLGLGVTRTQYVAVLSRERA